MALDFTNSGKRLLPPTDGRIAIGKKNERGLPTKLDYFIFTHEEDKKLGIAPINTEMTKVMTARYGEKPRSIRVVLPFDHPDEVFYTSFTDWKGKTDWSCKSDDGITALRKNKDGSITTCPCDYENCKFRLIGNDPNKTTCKPNGILSVFILDAPVMGGVWKFRTNAWGSVSKMQSALNMIHRVRGSLQGLEVELTVVMELQNVPDGKGGKTRQNVPVVQLKSPCSMLDVARGMGTVYGDFTEIQALAKANGRLPDQRKLAELAMELSAPPTEYDDDEATIEASVVEQQVSDDDLF